MTAISAARLCLCPDCLTGNLARASVFDADFWPNLLALTSPLVVLAIVCALLYRIGMRPPPEIGS